MKVSGGGKPRRKGCEDNVCARQLWRGGNEKKRKTGGPDKKQDTVGGKAQVHKSPLTVRHRQGRPLGGGKVLQKPKKKQPFKKASSVREIQAHGTTAWAQKSLSLSKGKKGGR